MEKGLRESSAEQTSFFLTATHVNRKSDQITKEKKREIFQATADIVSKLGDTKEVHHQCQIQPRLKGLPPMAFPTTT